MAKLKQPTALFDNVAKLNAKLTIQKATLKLFKLKHRNEIDTLKQRVETLESQVHTLLKSELSQSLMKIEESYKDQEIQTESDEVSDDKKTVTTSMQLVPRRTNADVVDEEIGREVSLQTVNVTHFKEKEQQPDERSLEQISSDYTEFIRNINSKIAALSCQAIVPARSKRRHQSQCQDPWDTDIDNAHAESISNIKLKIKQEIKEPCPIKQSHSETVPWSNEIEQNDYPLLRKSNKKGRISESYANKKYEADPWDTEVENKHLDSPSSTKSKKKRENRQHCPNQLADENQSGTENVNQADSSLPTKSKKKSKETDFCPKYPLEIEPRDIYSQEGSTELSSPLNSRKKNLEISKPSLNVKSAGDETEVQFEQAESLSSTKFKKKRKSKNSSSIKKTEDNPSDTEIEQEHTESASTINSDNNGGFSEPYPNKVPETNSSSQFVFAVKSRPPTTDVDDFSVSETEKPSLIWQAKPLSIAKSKPSITCPSQLNSKKKAGQAIHSEQSDVSNDVCTSVSEKEEEAKPILKPDDAADLRKTRSSGKGLAVRTPKWLLERQGLHTSVPNVPIKKAMLTSHHPCISKRGTRR